MLKEIPLLPDIDIKLLKKHVNGNNIYIKNYRKDQIIHYLNDEFSSLEFVISGSFIAYSLTEKAPIRVIYIIQKDPLIFDCQRLLKDGNLK